MAECVGNSCCSHFAPTGSSEALARSGGGDLGRMLGGGEGKRAEEGREPPVEGPAFADPGRADPGRLPLLPPPPPPMRSLESIRCAVLGRPSGTLSGERRGERPGERAGERGGDRAGEACCGGEGGGGGLVAGCCGASLGDRGGVSVETGDALRVSSADAAAASRPLRIGPWAVGSARAEVTGDRSNASAAIRMPDPDGGMAGGLRHERASADAGRPLRRSCAAEPPAASILGVRGWSAAVAS